MGGSGSGYFSSNIKDLKNKIADTTKDIDRKEYDANVESLLLDLLSQYNSRNISAINTHIEEILKAVENKIEGHLDIKLGGSVSKYTFVDGISDIDILLILNDSELSNKSPEAIKNYLNKILKERFPKSGISIGKMAVTVSFSDYPIQILPALKSGGKIMIPETSGNSWSKIDTEKFTSTLTKTNDNNKNKVVPIIKLAKAIINKLPEKHQLSGYHVEALAIGIFNNYRDEQTPKTMLKYFFQQASQIVLSPIKDKTGQSVFVDEYLGNKNSLSRQIISSALDRLYRKMHSADNLLSLEAWKDIFE
jgi:hypothetical protein